MAITQLTTQAENFQWIDVIDPSEEEVDQLSKTYHLHHYTLRDCLEPDHLPKHEQLEEANFLITRLLTGETKQKADSIQEMTNKVAIFYNKKFLITIHRRPQQFLTDLKDKYLVPGICKTTSATVIKILWNILNTYDRPGELLSKQVDELESKVFLKKVTPQILEELYYIKRKASVCNKLLLLTSEPIASIHSEDPVTQQDLKDLHVRLMHLYGQVHEDVTNLLNSYLSISTHKTNEVVKILTVFSVFFMPLTFIVGIYGMNFRFMPELEIPWGYPATMIFMAFTSLGIYVWFKKKEWL